MIFLVWKQSGVILRVAGEGHEMLTLVGPLSDWYPDKYPSPLGYKDLGEFVEAVEPPVLTTALVYTVTPQEAFAALHGLGLPEERDCTPSAVEMAFKKPIKRVNTRRVRNTNRSIIDWIEFEDGTKMYFGSAHDGAVIYRISKPHSYVQQMLDER